MNMKKIIKYILAVSLMLGMVVTMTACGKKDKDTKQYGKDNETILNENKQENNTTNTEKKDLNTTNDTTMSSNERYKIFANGLKSKLKKLQKSTQDPDGNTVDVDLIMYNFNNIAINITPTGDAYLCLSSSSAMAKKYGTKYKVKSNIINAGVSEYGQDGAKIFWFIDENGNVFYYDMGNISEDESSYTVNLNLKSLPKLKNITQIISKSYPDGVCSAGIDIDGNIIEIDEF